MQKPSGNPDELRTNQRRVMLMMGMLLLLLVACAAYLSWLMRS